MNKLTFFGSMLYYKLFHPSQSQQQIFIQDLMIAMGYPCDGNGVCFGLIKMWTNAVATGEEKQFFQRIQFMEDLYFELNTFANLKARDVKSDDKSFEINYQNAFRVALEKKLHAVKDKIKHGIIFDDLRANEKNLLEMESFLENISIIQYTNKYSYLYERYTGKDTIFNISSRLEKQGSVSSLYDYSYLDPANKPDKYLEDYFASLGAIISKYQNPREITMTLQNMDHCVGLRYEENNKWLYVEPNFLPGKVINTKDLCIALRKSLLTTDDNGKPDTFYFHIEINAINNEYRRDNLDKLRNALNHFYSNYTISSNNLAHEINYFSFLIHAAYYGHTDIIKELINQKIDINHQDSNGHSALNSAAEKNQTEAVKLLLQSGALPDKLDANDLTPLSWAAINNNIEMLSLLLAYNANVNQLNSNNKSALFVSALRSHADILEVLVAHGADINQANDDGNTPMHMAALNNNVAALKSLITHGADINSVNNHGCTPLIAAAMYDSYEAMKLLLQAGADKKYVSDEGTALKIAQDRGNTRIIKLLRNVNSDMNSSQTFFKHIANSGKAHVMQSLENQEHRRQAS